MSVSDSIFSGITVRAYPRRQISRVKKRRQLRVVDGIPIARSVHHLIGAYMTYMSYESEILEIYGEAQPQKLLTFLIFLKLFTFLR